MSNRLSPEARARLEAAKAVAQGRATPAPKTTTPAAGRPARPAAPAGKAAAEVPAGAEPRRGRGGLAIAGSVAAVVALAVAGWMLRSSRPDLLGSTAAIQSGLLEGRLDEAARKQAVAEVIRNADRMTKEELDSARKSLDEEWQRLRDLAIDAFFAAPEGERASLADRGIDLTIAYRKLRFGLSPQARDDGGRRQRPPKDRERRKLFERYGEALVAQAKKRGIALPEWQ